MDQALAWCGEWYELPIPDCRHCAFFLLSRVLNLSKNRMKTVFDLKLMVGLGEHKVVLDESGFRVYSV